LSAASARSGLSSGRLSVCPWRRFLSAAGLFFLFALLLLSPSNPVQAQASSEAEPFLPDAILHPGDKPGLIMVVNKADQLMMIFRHDGQGRIWLDRVLPCSTGMIQGDKLVRGDKKTPEGYYIFRQKLLPAELPDIYGILAYPMDYPNFYDRKIGRGGDGIWTHGINKPLVDYDSNGCIELLNHDLALLETEIELQDTPILVYDKLTLAEAAALRAEAEDLLAFVERWREAWVTKNMPAYASLYDPEFHNTDELSYQGWMDKKTRVAANYDTIEVELSDLKVFRHRDAVVVSFVQDYRGDSRFRSQGGKRLYLKGEVGDWRIVAEEFGPMPSSRTSKWLTAAEKNDALNTPPLAVAQVSSPAAMAFAGVVLPGGSVSPAPGKTSPPQSLVEAAADEEARAAIEKRTQTASEAQASLSAADTAEEADTAAEASDVQVAGNASSEIFSRSSSTLVASASSGVVELPASPSAANATAQMTTLTDGRDSADGPNPDENLADENLVDSDLADEPSAEDDAVEDDSAEDDSAEDDSDEAYAAVLPEASDETGSAGASVSASATSSASSTPVALATYDEAAEAESRDAERRSATSAAASAANLKADEAAIEELLDEWLLAWSEQDEDRFFSFYASDFLFKDLNLHLSSYKRYRGKRIREAGSIDVAAADVQVKVQGARAVVTFVQTYKSDKFSDKGLKTLELGVRDGRWSITSESFQAR
jgi:murein L,D-transpeptidase YafK/ketosteroid isomerase-like protein